MVKTTVVDPIWRKEDFADYFKVTPTTIDNWKRDQERNPKVPEYDVVLSARVKGWHLSTLIQAGWPIKLKELADTV